VPAAEPDRDVDEDAAEKIDGESGVEAVGLVLEGRRQAGMQDPEVDAVSDEDRDRVLDPTALRHGTESIAAAPSRPRGAHA
jgi:hypothetical protein